MFGFLVTLPARLLSRAFWSLVPSGTPRDDDDSDSSDYQYDSIDEVDDDDDDDDDDEGFGDQATLGPAIRVAERTFLIKRRDLTLLAHAIERADIMAAMVPTPAIDMSIDGEHAVDMALVDCVCTHPESSFLQTVYAALQQHAPTALDTDIMSIPPAAAAVLCGGDVRNTNADADADAWVLLPMWTWCVYKMATLVRDTS